MASITFMCFIIVYMYLFGRLICWLASLTCLECSKMLFSLFILSPGATPISFFTPTQNTDQPFYHQLYTMCICSKHTDFSRQRECALSSSKQSRDWMVLSSFTFHFVPKSLIMDMNVLTRQTRGTAIFINIFSSFLSLIQVNGFEIYRGSTCKLQVDF